MKQLGERWINFLDQREIFSMSSSPLGRKVLQDGRVGRKSGCTFITVFSPSKHCNTNYSFDHFIKPLVYPMDIIHTIRTWRCILLLPLVGYVTNTQPYLKSVPSTVSPVSGTQWKQSHRPDASNVFPQWNTQLSLWRSAIKIPDFCLEPATMFTDKHLEFGMIEIESAQCVIWRISYLMHMQLTHQANKYIQAIFSFWPIQVYPALYTTYGIGCPLFTHLYKIPDAGSSLHFGLIETESTVIKINCSENKDGMFSLQIMHWTLLISIMPNSKCLL